MASLNQREEQSAIQALAYRAVKAAAELLQIQKPSAGAWDEYDACEDSFQKGVYRIRIQYYRPHTPRHRVFVVGITFDQLTRIAHLTGIQLVQYGDCRLNIEFVPSRKTTLHTKRIALKLIKPGVVSHNPRQKARIKATLCKYQMGLWYT